MQVKLITGNPAVVETQLTALFKEKVAQVINIDVGYQVQWSDDIVTGMRRQEEALAVVVVYK